MICRGFLIMVSGCCGEVFRVIGEIGNVGYGCEEVVSRYVYYLDLGFFFGGVIYVLCVYRVRLGLIWFYFASWGCRVLDFN